MEGGGGGGQKAPSLPKICQTSYNGEACHNYTLLKEDPQKFMNHVTYPLSSADISIFSLEINKFSYIGKYRYRLHFGT